MKSKSLVISLLVIAGFVGMFFFGKSQGNRQTTIDYDTVTVTQEIPIDRIVYRNLPGRLDTVRVVLHDTVMLNVPMASIDTVLKPYNDSLSIQYLFPPVNRFSLVFAPSPRPVEIQYVNTTKTVYIEDSWIVDVLKIGGGIGIGFVGGRLSK